MKKSKVIEFFGSGTALAKLIGVSKQAVSQMPDDLPQSQVDRILGAALRRNIDTQKLFSEQRVSSGD